MITTHEVAPFVLGTTLTPESRKQINALAGADRRIMNIALYTAKRLVAIFLLTGKHEVPMFRAVGRTMSFTDIKSEIVSGGNEEGGLRHAHSKFFQQPKVSQFFRGGSYRSIQIAENQAAGVISVGYILGMSKNPDSNRDETRHPSEYLFPLLNGVQPGRLFPPNKDSMFMKRMVNWAKERKLDFPIQKKPSAKEERVSELRSAALRTHEMIKQYVSSGKMRRTPQSIVRLSQKDLLKKFKLAPMQHTRKFKKKHEDAEWRERVRIIVRKMQMKGIRERDVFLRFTKFTIPSNSAKIAKIAANGFEQGFRVATRQFGGKSKGT